MAAPGRSGGCVNIQALNNALNVFSNVVQQVATASPQQLPTVTPAPAAGVGPTDLYHQLSQEAVFQNERVCVRLLLGMDRFECLSSKHYC